MPSKSHNKYWFRPKRFGYGLEPISWEGWVATFGLIAFLLIAGILFGIYSEPPTVSDLVLFFIVVGLTVASFLTRMKSRTKGELKWHWGRQDEKKD